MPVVFIRLSILSISMDLLIRDDKGKVGSAEPASKQDRSQTLKNPFRNRESFWTSCLGPLRCHDGITKCRIAAAPSLRAFCPERFIV
jgi:hypothetical protein